LYAERSAAAASAAGSGARSCYHRDVFDLESRHRSN